MNKQKLKSKNSPSKWYSAKVIRGEQIGRTIGFPTVNLELNDQDSMLKTKKGVHYCQVKINGKLYDGLLYFGPRLVRNEKKDVIEIHILEFDQEIYDQEIDFRIIKHIRGVKSINNLNELKEQIGKDIHEVRRLI